jgi:hypothetical protein
MFGTISDLYVKYGPIRWVYQATWLVFGWLPAVFWPVQLIAAGLSWLWAHFPSFFGLFSPWG